MRAVLDQAVLLGLLVLPDRCHRGLEGLGLLQLVLDFPSRARVEKAGRREGLPIEVIISEGSEGKNATPALRLSDSPLALSVVVPA